MPTVPSIWRWHLLGADLPGALLDHECWKEVSRWSPGCFCVGEEGFVASDGIHFTPKDEVVQFRSLMNAPRKSIVSSLTKFRFSVMMRADHAAYEK